MHQFIMQCPKYKYLNHKYSNHKFIFVICVSMIILIILLSTGCSYFDSDADYEKALEESVAQKESAKQEVLQEKELQKNNLPIIEDNIAEKSESTESEPTDIAIEIKQDKEEYVIGDKPLLK